MNKIKYLIRKIVQLKFFLNVAYDWARTPALIAIAIGVLKPYIDQYVDVSLWMLVIITTFGTILSGYLLVKLGIIKEATNYAQEQNGLLNSKVDKNQESIEEIKKMLEKR